MTTTPTPASHDTAGSTGTAEFIVVANRLPVDRVDNPKPGESAWSPSPGGLVAALKPVLENNHGAWVGWPGTTATVTAADMPDAAESGITMVPVNLDAEDFADFYEGFSNATLWPLYHDLIVTPAFHRHWWRRYHEVNERFAAATVRAAAPGARVWVQDYQLHLVPNMIRSQRPDVAIGFFLHIPFPAPELFRQLPWRNAVLEGTLGADIVGFHTQDSARNFMLTLRAMNHNVTIFDDDDATYLRGARLPEEGQIVGTVRVSDDRLVRIGVFPISIASENVIAMAKRDAVVTGARKLREELGNPEIIFAGVDRLDYTKGITQRLLAIEQLLDTGRLRAEDIAMVQVATPSRERLDDYQLTRDEVEKTVSRINGNYGGLARPVIHYIHSSLPFEEIVTLYSAADVMLVTPFKDGMNLVAKEYVASHTDGSGALVLSEFAGAATELTSSYLCNPHDVDSIAAAIMNAIADTPEKRTRRMETMADHVAKHDVAYWADSFLQHLHSRRRPTTAGELPALSSSDLAEQAAAPELLIAMDFDGTLAPLNDDPAAVRAEAGAIEALVDLAALPHTSVMVISGRDIAQLVDLTGLDPEGPVILVGSHGGETPSGSLEITGAEQSRLDTLRQLAERLATGVEGAWVETKPLSIGLHTRLVADRDLGAKLLAQFTTDASKIPGTHLTMGKDIADVAVRRISKGGFISQWRVQQTQHGSEPQIVFAGDDVTDETVLNVLTDDDLGVHVRGENRADRDPASVITTATRTVNSTVDVRDMLQELLELRRSTQDRM